MTLVDDFGRYDGRAALLHGECFALRNDIKPQQTAECLQELHDVGLVQLYEVEGKHYLQMERWHERARSDKSRIPDPPQRSAGFRRIPQEKDASLATTSKPSPLAIASPADADWPGVLDTENFRTAWADWEAHRREIKKPLTPTSRKQQLSHLAELGEARALAAIRNTIFKGWQGLKEPESNNGTHKPSNTESRRNVGTANEGRSSQYAGVGKIQGV